MADVKSKNLYELLGNDHDEDSDKDPSPPTKAIDKTLPRSTKQNAPERSAGGGAERGGRRGGFSGNEGAFRDSGAGSQNNRAKRTDDGTVDKSKVRGARGGARGGRGGTFRENRDDRHSRGPQNEHTKQANHSWGGATGGSEWDDEKAGEAIAQAEAKDPEAVKGPDAPTDADGNALAAASAEEPEPEDNSKSYEEYLAELAEKKLNLGSAPEARKPNEGSKIDKKWKDAKALTKAEEEDFIAARDRKAGRTRERKEKQVVDIDHRFVESARGSDRGGRGRGGRGDGGYRGRGEGGRGRGEGRGRGGRGGDFRGSSRGGARGGRGGEQVNLADTSAFPSLGS